MRIENLQLKNFRSHESLSIDLAKFNFVIGSNACGKSSIAMSIEYGLTGRCQVTDQRGAGSEDLIRIGSKELQVGMFVLTGMPNAWSLNRFKGVKTHELQLQAAGVLPLPDAQRKLYERLGVSPDVLSACLNSGRFLSMDDKGQKQLLAQVLVSDKIIAPKSIVHDAGLVDRGFATWTGEIDSISEIDSDHKRFYDTRTEVNREIKALGVLTEPELPADAPDYKTVWKLLDDLRAQVTRVSSERTRLDERYQGALRSASEKRAQLKEQRKAAASRQLTEDEAATFQKIAEHRDKAKALQAKLRDLQKKIEDLTATAKQDFAVRVATCQQNIETVSAKIREKEDQITAVQKLKEGCPTCQRALTASDQKALVKALKDDVASLTAVRDAAQTELQELRDTNNVKPAGLDKFEDDYEKIKKQFDGLGDFAAAEERLKNDREALIDVSRIDRELAAIKDPEPPDTGKLSEELDTLSARVGRGEQVLDEVRGIEASRKAYDEWKEKKDALEAKIEVLERLIDFLGPNGIKATMVGDKIAPFTIAMNKSLNQFGYVANFTLEPYRFNVAEASGGQWRSLKQLSESEQFRFSVAFQIALAMATGLKFVVIDRADVLDTESRSALTAMLVESDLDQAIVLSTTDKEAPAELPSGVKFIDLSQSKAIGA